MVIACPTRPLSCFNLLSCHTCTFALLLYVCVKSEFILCVLLLNPVYVLLILTCMFWKICAQSVFILCLTWQSPVVFSAVHIVDLINIYSNVPGGAVVAFTSVTLINWNNLLGWNLGSAFIAIFASMNLVGRENLCVRVLDVVLPSCSSTWSKAAICTPVPSSSSNHSWS